MRAASGLTGPLCILACENLQRNSGELRRHTEALLSTKKDREALLRGVHFCDTLVDRVCSGISCVDGQVVVPVEKFHSWVVNEPRVRIKVLEALSKSKLIRLVNNLEFNSLEAQKYWCLNGAHLAAAAYAYNHNPNLMHFDDALAVPAIRGKVWALQEELGLALYLYAHRQGLRSRFSEIVIVKYNRQVFQRIKKNRTDTIARVLKQEGAAVSGIVEVLNRMDRLLEPQGEILAHRKGLEGLKYEAIALHAAPHRKDRLELDDAITQVIFALRNFYANYSN